MRTTPRTATLPLAALALLALPALASLTACSKDESSAAPSASASAAPPATTSAPVASASSAPSAAPPAVEPHHDCPPGSSGIGSFSKPCEAKGNARTMTVKWTKTGDSGPSFAVTNTSKIVIVHGRIAVYFYDKAGKQLPIPDPDDSTKTKPFHTCGGNFFGGVMNPGEKETLTFSCVPKKVIPDGTVTIEAEIPMVGFADASGKKIDYYWRNNDLTPEARPKGGVK